MRWPEGLFGTALQGDEKRGGEACWETDGERDGEIARQRKSGTQGIFWGRERETEKRIRPIEAWHDRVSDDGCLCISHCLHQRHRNTTHTHSASSYKHRCSPIRQRWGLRQSVDYLPFSWLGEAILCWIKPCSLLGKRPKKTYYPCSHWRKKTDCDLINNLLRRHNSAKVKPLDRMQLSGELFPITVLVNLRQRS